VNGCIVYKNPDSPANAGANGTLASAITSITEGAFHKRSKAQTKQTKTFLSLLVANQHNQWNLRRVAFCYSISRTNCQIEFHSPTSTPNQKSKIDKARKNTRKDGSMNQRVDEKTKEQKDK
jgi:hypothetical protein